MKNLLFSVLLLFSLNAMDVFVAGEGSFYNPGSGSITRINDNGNVNIFENIGSIVHAVEAYQNILLVSVNGEYKIQIYNISEQGLELNTEISMDGQSPREIIVINHKAFITTWDPDWTIYPNIDGLVKVINLDNFQLEESIQVGIMPEGLVYSNGYLWVANSGESTISKINTTNNLVEDEVYVSQGPLFLTELNNVIYVARTYYDNNWNTNFGSSKVGINANAQIMEYGAGIACGGSIMKYNNSIYRSFEGGIAPINQNLEILSDEKIGDYDPSMLYHADIINDNIWLTITDFSNINKVKVLNNSGDEINSFNVGAIPGDLTHWSMCYFSGDANRDEAVNVFDVVLIVDNVINSQIYDCETDLNADGTTNVLDVIETTELIFN